MLQNDYDDEKLKSPAAYGKHKDNWSSSRRYGGLLFGKFRHRIQIDTQQPESTSEEKREE